VRFGDPADAYFYGFWESIEWSWKANLWVVVEGPKDARVVSGYSCPSVATLGSAPSQKQLRCLRRYASRILWVPDRDPDSRNDTQRRIEARRRMTEMGFEWYEVRPPCKDPALAPFKAPQFLPYLRERAETLRRIR
jgi:hypothetical protein